MEVKEQSIEEEEVTEGEEEWPSLGLDLAVKEESVEVKEESIEDEEEIEEEKEWPSLGLDLAVKEESGEVYEESVQEEEEEIEEEKEWPSINSIPGLEVSVSKPRPEKLQSKSQSRLAEDESLSSSLGELRFQDE